MALWEERHGDLSLSLFRAAFAFAVFAWDINFGTEQNRLFEPNRSASGHHAKS
jgi:hypothetical protein